LSAYDDTFYVAGCGVVLALQAFASIEWFMGDAIESFAAEILCDALNWCRFSLPP
jgi:hypothetical protein